MHSHDWKWAWQPKNFWMCFVCQWLNPLPKFLNLPLHMIECLSASIIWQGQRTRPGRPGNCRTNIFDFSHEIEEVASVYKDDIDVSELSTELEIFGTSFSEPKATIHQVIKCLQSLSVS